MTLNVEKELAALRRMTFGELKQKFAEVCGEEPRSRNKQWMIKRTIWKMQARAEGIDLSERALQRARELADFSDLRLSAPRRSMNAPPPDATDTLMPVAPLDPRLPMPGTLITRKYKGQTLQVKVLVEGFEFEGERYKSLSAVARRITGSAWNGFLFFNLCKKGAEA